MFRPSSGSAMARRAVLAGALAAPAVARGQADAWPDRPVRLVVPFGAGGAIDTFARLLQPHFAPRANNQPLVVDNRPGAGGTVAAAAVAQARPDGATLLMADVGPNGAAGALYANLPYDPARSFTPIIHLVNLPTVLVARPGLDARDFAALLAEAPRRPDGFTYGSVGVGHTSHLAMEVLQRRVGARMVHVPYRSGGEVTGALARGECDMTLTSIATAMPFLRAGTLRPLAVAATAPAAALREVPAGGAMVPGFEAVQWYGLVGPAGLPAPVVAAANAVFNRILAEPELRASLERVQFAEILGGTPERFGDWIRAEIARWGAVVREAGIRVE